MKKDLNRLYHYAFMYRLWSTSSDLHTYIHGIHMSGMPRMVVNRMREHIYTTIQR